MTNLLFCFTDITDILSLEEEKRMKNVMETCVLVSKTTLIFFFVYNSFIVSVFEIL
jgi:hypothetical protein